MLLLDMELAEDSVVGKSVLFRFMHTFYPVYPYWFLTLPGALLLFLISSCENPKTFRTTPMNSTSLAASSTVNTTQSGFFVRFAHYDTIE